MRYRIMKKNSLIMMMFFAILSVMLTGCGVSDSQSSGDTAQVVQKVNYSVLSEGSDAPDFTADVNDGNTFTLSEKQGKVVLLNFWATWCGPCVGEMPAFQKLYEEYGDEIEILAVNIAEDRETVDAFVENCGYTFPIAYDEGGQISIKYPSEGIPYTLVIGKDGKVSAIFLGAAGADEQYRIYRNALKKAFLE